jgi:hypothetical protein
MNEASKVRLLLYATRFSVPPSHEVKAKLFADDEIDPVVFIESRASDRWTVLRPGAGCALNRNLLWEHEPIPSSRTDDFRWRTRFTLDEALALIGRRDLQGTHHE